MTQEKEKKRKKRYGRAFLPQLNDMEECLWINRIGLSPKDDE
jgi:hypothetical protein